MEQSRTLSLAITATLSMSVLIGFSSINTLHAKSIPTHASIGSPNTGNSDLVYAAQVLLGGATNNKRNAVSQKQKAIPRRITKQYRPSTATPQLYKVSHTNNKTYDPILDNPAYRQQLLEMAGLSSPKPVKYVKQQPVAVQQAYFKPAQAVRTNQTQSQTPYAANEDMWNQIRNGYHMGNHGWRKQVQHFARSYGSNPERLQRIANRATDYLHIVVTELKRRRMPTELALLPFVESAYVNTAHSHAGAAGMWQFIPSTGRIYGLKQNRGFDGRMDALESTRAALDYLQKLHRQFKGDWFLALAAYNAGEGRVSRAIKYNRARGRKTDYWNIRLPRETREYVPRLLAYKEIIARPNTYGFRLPRTPNISKLAEIHVNKPVNLRKAAIHAGLTPDALTSLNPNFLKGITTPNISRRILLPSSHAGHLAHVIKWLPAEKPVSTRATTRVRYVKKKSKSRYKTHRVKRGETLYRIAMKHGLTVSKLKRLNGMRSDKIKTGARLRLI